MRRTITGSLLVLSIMALLICPFVKTVEAKTYKSLPKGSYYVTYKSAKISKGKLCIKGNVKNWERAIKTKDYDKTGKFKLKIKKKCELMDGYKPDYKISKSKFNKLCKKRDNYHRHFVVMVKKKKVVLIRFW